MIQNILILIAVAGKDIGDQRLGISEPQGDQDRYSQVTEEKYLDRIPAPFSHAKLSHISFSAERTIRSSKS